MAQRRDVASRRNSFDTSSVPTDSAAERSLIAEIDKLTSERDLLDRRIEALRAGLAALRGDDPGLPSRRPSRPVPRTQRVVRELEQAGARGMTRLELAEALGEDNPDLLSNGLTHLKNAGRVRRDGGRWFSAL